MQLDGKRIVVTGGARGIGAAAVRAFVREGAVVQAIDLRDDLGEQVAATATARGPGRARYSRCDVSRRAEVKEVFAKCALDMGGVDALVHIAGVHREAPPELITDEDWDFVLDVNLRGTFITNQEAFPYLRDQGDGRIVNFGSMAGQVPYVLAAHYSASKGAVLSWSRTVAQAWGRYGIKVNAVTPAIETPMSHEVLEREQSNPDAPPRKSFSSTAGRDMGDPDRDMAPVLVFLLTDGARHITAQIIAVDGGMTPVR